MPLNTWSDNITIAELSDEPMFSEDMDGLLQRLEEAVKSEESIPNVVVDLKSVATVNSSNLGALLKLRTMLGQNDRRLLICSVTDGVWKLVWRETAPSNSELFNLSEDPLELTNLYSEDHEQAKRLYAFLETNQAWKVEPPGESSQTASPDALKGLGYGGD